MIINKKAEKILDILNYGQKNTSAISKETNIPRTTVEYILRHLEKSKFVNSKKAGQATIWSKNILYEKETSIIYGIDNIINAFKLSVKKNGTEVIIIESDQSMSLIENKGYNDLFKKLNEKFQEKHSLIYILFHKKTIIRLDNMLKKDKIKKKTISALINRAMSAYLLPDDLFDLKIHIAIIGEKIFFTDFKLEKSLCIKNPILAVFFKHLFIFTSQTQNKIDTGATLKILLSKYLG